MTNNLFDYPFLDDAHYLVACTYGPDSMALLDMMMKANVKPIVCFVNYHTGNDCEEAEQKMRLFCQEHDLSLEVCDTNFVPQDGRDDDFEAWSRKTRYDFFKEIYVKYDAAALFIAHQQDDLIETYLLGKQNGVTKSRYGVGKISTYQGMMVVRPLLDFTSADLHHYCHENNVPFLPDMSNFEDLHTRNKIRHEVIDKLTEIERGQILDEMRRVNDDKIGFVKGLDQQIKIGEELNIREILALSPDDYAGTLTAYINKKSPIRIAVTPTMLSAIRKMCVNPQANMSMKLKGSIYLVKEYDVISLDDDGQDMPYSYVLEKPGVFSCEAFDLDFTNGAADRNIHPEDYPLTVRSSLPQDVTTYGGYLVPVRRMLVAAGISQRLLHIWPVFLNKDGKIIYVPRYKKGFSEYHTSKLAIHVKNDEK